MAQYSTQNNQSDGRGHSVNQISEGMNHMSLNPQGPAPSGGTSFYVPPFRRNQPENQGFGGNDRSNNDGFRGGSNYRSGGSSDYRSGGGSDRNFDDGFRGGSSFRNGGGDGGRSGFGSQDRERFGSGNFGSGCSSYNRSRDCRGGDMNRRNGPMQDSSQRRFPSGPGNSRYPDQQSGGRPGFQQQQQQQGREPQVCAHEVPTMFLEPGTGHWDAQRGHVVAARSTTMEEKLYKSEHVSTGINFSKYEEIPVEANGKDVPRPITSFSDAGLTPLLQENIELAKYTVPTPVQKFSIPIVKQLRDLMACAQTGSGKTAGFLFPILNDLFDKGPQYSQNPCPEVHRGQGFSRRGCAYPIVLILAPTRELTSQIFEEAKRFTYRSWVRPAAIYGGVPCQPQTENLRSGCGLLVATPGRLNDLIGRGFVSLNHIRYLVLDEADRMLDMGFEPQIRQIVEHSNMPSKNNRVTLMFSATFPGSIQLLASDFLNDYVFLSVGRVGSASENVKQVVLLVPEMQKKDFLLDILGSETQTSKTLIFVETKRLADELANFLTFRRYPAVAIHGDRTQEQREDALQSFRDGKKPILVATAVAGRGLDILNVTHVINYDLPNDIDDYVHRIGRTGRAGNMGKSTAFFDRQKNYQIASDLVKILADAKQEIPDFLTSGSCRPSYGGSGGSSRTGFKGSRGGRPGASQRDFRSDPEYANYSSEQRLTEREPYRRTNGDW